MNKIVFDSSSIINLINGEVLNDILKLQGYIFYIGNIVLEECSRVQSQKDVIEKYIQEGKIKLIEEDVDLTVFRTLKTKYNLGDGETECIGYCKGTAFKLSSDDGKARRDATTELGASHVTGSIFLLREAVRFQIIECRSAKSAFLFMKIKGGFLPEVADEYFCEQQTVNQQNSGSAS